MTDRYRVERLTATGLYEVTDYRAMSRIAGPYKARGDAEQAARWWNSLNAQIEALSAVTRKNVMDTYLRPARY